MNICIRDHTVNTITTSHSINPIITTTTTCNTSGAAALQNHTTKTINSGETRGITTVLRSVTSSYNTASLTTSDYLTHYSLHSQSIGKLSQKMSLSILQY
ncbi:hypothetical protein Hamer_G030177 [Homarus americanus]|uniref:Uncharacterized protein n=1 Tax=Homarus americanus TaxID=6706 RepID=A0A8J5MZF6_HOMAM|nr:hypothetical protein Hamer_G025049 [Homarus americanus]KAG7169204.1 hypothetical protein Hamer_G030177 [Homarus americanus]